MSFTQKCRIFSLVMIIIGIESVARADTILASNTYLGTRHINGAPLTTQNAYFYGTSSTAAATAAKAVTISSIDASSLSAGQVIVVNPANTSTATTAHTLSLNSGTAKPIYYNGAAVNTAALGAKVWAAGVPSTFVYDGTNWVFAGSGGESGQTYNNFGGANGSAAGTAGLVPAPAATDNTKFLRGDGTWATVNLPVSSGAPSSNTPTGSAEIWLQ